MDPKQEMDLLQAEAEDIKAELDAVNKRLAELREDKKEG
jgi:prefoldin subunit 5